MCERAIILYIACLDFRYCHHQKGGDCRHGQGTQSYPNGDFYDGEWRKGLQNGHGRYQWKNGNHYIGQWRNGLFYGNGTMMWSNGNRYDGCWEEGLPMGNGTFRWGGDGSFYVGEDVESILYKLLVVCVLFCTILMFD